MSNPPNPIDAAADEADRLLAAAIYLMSCHARNRCPRLAVMIARHLQLIAANAGAGERVAHTCRRLANAWHAIVRHDERVQQTLADVAHKLH